MSWFYLLLFEEQINKACSMQRSQSNGDRGGRTWALPKGNDLFGERLGGVRRETMSCLKKKKRRDHERVIKAGEQAGHQKGWF